MGQRRNRDRARPQPGRRPRHRRGRSGAAERRRHGRVHRRRDGRQPDRLLLPTVRSRPGLGDNERLRPPGARRRHIQPGVAPLRSRRRSGPLRAASGRSWCARHRRHRLVARHPQRLPHPRPRVRRLCHGVRRVRRRRRRHRGRGLDGGAPRRAAAGDRPARRRRLHSAPGLSVPAAGAPGARRRGSVRRLVPRGLSGPQPSTRHRRHARHAAPGVDVARPRRHRARDHRDPDHGDAPPGAPRRPAAGHRRAAGRARRAGRPAHPPRGWPAAPAVDARHPRPREPARPRRGSPLWPSPSPSSGPS